MSEEPPDPETLAEMASAETVEQSTPEMGASPGDMAESVANVATDSDDSGTGPVKKITRALLSTEPDESPSDYPDLPEYTAHFLIALKQMANELAPSANVGTGTPAVAHLAIGAKKLGDRQSEDETEGWER